METIQINLTVEKRTLRFGGENDTHLGLKLLAARDGIKRGFIPLIEWPYESKRIDVIWLGDHWRPVAIIECEYNPSYTETKTGLRDRVTGERPPAFNWTKPNLRQFEVETFYIYTEADRGTSEWPQLEFFEPVFCDMDEIDNRKNALTISFNLPASQATEMAGWLSGFRVGDSKHRRFLDRVEASLDG